MVNRLIATGLLAITSLWLVACGTGGVGTTGIPNKDESHSGAGVWAGNYEVIRYNEAGFPDPSLNSTLQLALNEKGGQTALVISVRDSVNTGTVAVDVHYDGGAVHPEDVKFFGALGDDSRVLSASFLTQIPGTAAIGQTGINDYRPAQINGTFASVTFAPGGLRSVSAAGQPHQSDVGLDYKVGEAATNTVGDSDPDPDYLTSIVVDDDQTAHPGSLDVAWYASWHLADGNQNGQVEIADLSPLGKYLNVNLTDNFAALPADYDGNGLVLSTDLSKMGKHLGEGTDNYHVEVNDNDGTENGLTVVGDYDWGQDALSADWTAPTAPAEAAFPDPETLDPVFKKWTIHIDDASSVTMQQLSEIDLAGNQDGKVAFHITPQRGGVDGPFTSVVEAEAGIIDTTRYVTVNEVTIRVIGATGGDDDGTVFDSDTTAGSVVANSTVNFAIEGIKGIYSSTVGGGSFSSGTYPADMTQQDYDDALAIVNETGDTGFVEFTPAQGGAAGFRYRSDWVTFNPAPPLFGNMGDGTVFPDDDPESTGATAEGVMTVKLNTAPDQDDATERSIQLSSYTAVFTFDVTADPNAPILEDPINLLTGQPVTTLTTLDGTHIAQDLSMPGTIQDPTGVSYSLIEIGPTGAALGAPIDFDYQDGAPDQGQFFVRSVDPPSLQAFVTGLINPSSQYHFTFKDDAGGPWSSLNTPEPVLTTVAPLPPQDLVTIPDRLGSPVNTGEAFINLRIMYKNPKVRRIPDETIDPLNGTVKVEDWNLEGFNDVLKIAGDEIVPGVDSGQIFPRFTVISNPTNDPNFGPDMINSTTATEIGATVSEVARDHITVNFAGWPSWPSTGELQCAYKLFNKNDSALGQGEFVMQALRFSDVAPTGTAWGVNVFDRENTSTATIDDVAGLYGNKTIKLSNVGTNRPDVLWFQFGGGYVSSAIDGNNVQALFEWWDGNENDWSDGPARLDLRVAGVTDNLEVLAIHVVVPEDFIGGGGQGNFLPGNSYVVHLNDPQIPGEYDDTYGIGNPQGDENMLFVSGG